MTAITVAETPILLHALRLADGALVHGPAAYPQPAWDVRRCTVWYTDGNSGFYAVRLTNGIGRLLRR